jgi:hypothetical protein
MRINLSPRSRPVLRALNTATLVVLGGVVLTGCQDATTTSSAADDTSNEIVEFALTPEGAAAARGATMTASHKLPIIALRQQPDVKFSASVAGSADNSPFDLTNFGGKVLTGAMSYAVYVNCNLPNTPATCWGNGTTLAPGNFLRNLNNSNYIRIVNEYIGGDAFQKFPARDMKTQAVFANPQSATLQEIFHIVADASSRSGLSGYDAIYHVFLPQGTNMCIVAGNCYSPNDPASWAFCAFHGGTNLSDGRYVLFTVEPYQGVDGCRLPAQTPNGLMDATASTLAHELFETITDPDLDGWSNALFGYEMSDLCFAFGAPKLLNGNSYFLQAEYSNKTHMCMTSVPF